MFNKSRILITGGSGTLGTELAKQLMDYNCADIIIFSRSEVAQVDMKRRFPNLTYVIGDIRDKKAVKEACKGVDIVFHLAALKHVTICENQPLEAVKTNILGTQNVIDSCGRVIFMSTDKAINPVCVYGYTKAIGEKIVSQANGISIRSGNIFGSSGSVIPLFISQAKNKKPITLTDGDMTRFFIPVHELARFLLWVTESKPTGIYFPSEMNAFKMRDVAEVITELYGSDAGIVESGAKVGERKHETLDGIHYSNELLGTKQDLKEMFKWLQ
jgi:UDP-N-acetylglucosamine 4,6-dehydratase